MPVALDDLALDPDRCAVIRPDGSTVLLGKLLPLDERHPHNAPAVRCFVCGGTDALTLDPDDRFVHRDPASCRRSTLTTNPEETPST